MNQTNLSNKRVIDLTTDELGELILQVIQNGTIPAKTTKQQWVRGRRAAGLELGVSDVTVWKREKSGLIPPEAVSRQGATLFYNIDRIRESWGMK